MISSVEAWLQGTSVAAFMIQNPWAWAICESLHFVGLCCLLGPVVLMDVRMLGAARSVPLSALHGLVPFAVAGFVLNLVTGAMFIAATPEQYLHNPVFYLKMLFIGLAGANVLVFHGAGIFSQVVALGPGDAPVARAKVLAAVSLLLWLGVIAWGRLMPFLSAGVEGAS
ncbi:MAG: hypothetical protein FJW23_07430 [Acidimicrobiia bacterium]|nr:hypothetical protein [Acidimicrobiia bacterium]